MHDTLTRFPQLPSGWPSPGPLASRGSTAGDVALPARRRWVLTLPALSLAAMSLGTTAALANTPRTIGWEALVPPGWDPMKEFKEPGLSILSDADPRAQQMMSRLRELWDRAPVNNAIVGQAVRLPGFVVPLEETREGVKEFLLVPYFGACIHSPPPPANQIVHVLPKSPAKGLRSMDTVWVSGVIEAIRTDSYMGVSGYRIRADAVAPYTDRK